MAACLLYRHHRQADAAEMEAEGRPHPRPSFAAVERMALVPSTAGAAQVWVPRGYATSASLSSPSVVVAAAEQGGACDRLCRLIKGALEFPVDNNTFTKAHIRATFYPKFDNEKSDQEQCRLMS